MTSSIDDTYALWGKAASETGTSYHPLMCHMIDVANVAQRLWDLALEDSLRRMVSLWLNLPGDETGRWISYWAGLHDIGKASPAFQRKNANLKAGLQQRGFRFGRLTGDLPHGISTARALRDLLTEAGAGQLPKEFANAVARTLGGHHGRFPSSIALRKILPRAYGNDHQWQNIRRRLVFELGNLLGLNSWQRIDCKTPPPAFFVALAGITCVADWIGSNERFFPYEDSLMDPRRYLDRSSRRASQAVSELGWTAAHLKSFTGTFSGQFPRLTPPRPLQVEVERLSQSLTSEQYMAIIEAPMGEGKTEAAIFMAHSSVDKQGLRGWYFALPTQATSNQMHSRVSDYLSRQWEGGRIAVSLNHGNALLDIDDKALAVTSDDDDEDQTTNPAASASGSEWFLPRKRALLSQFGVGTIDQALLATLQTRHFFVRMLGLAGKVVVIDEVHAYDTYMSTLLEQLLAWLRSIGTSVILLSATLPESKKQTLLSAFNPDASIVNPTDYPRVTWTSTRSTGSVEFKASQRLKFEVENVPDSMYALVDRIVTEVSSGGCVAVICNTVQRAQETYQAFRQADVLSQDELILFHARFPYEQRMGIERRVLQSFGPDGERPHRSVLVATQVVEQSLDLDFDLMVTDLAPIDLVLQRAGRVHRHLRQRPSQMNRPRLWIVMPSKGQNGVPNVETLAGIYERDVVLKSYSVLADLTEIKVPKDLERLIESVYGEVWTSSDNLDLTTAISDAEIQTKESHRLAVAKARQNLVLHAKQIDNALDFLDQTNRQLAEDNPDLHDSLRALTRDSALSVQVVCLDVDELGRYSLPDQGVIDPDRRPNTEMAKRLLRRSLSISSRRLAGALLGQPVPNGWSKHPALKYHRLLGFENGETKIGNVVVRLDPELGLVIDGGRPTS